MKKYILLFLITLISSYTLANDIINLPPPELPEISLQEALENRHSTRNFDKKDIRMSELSAILWSAFGVNRSENGKRTAPSAFNFQDIKIYVFTDKEIFLYLAENHQLKRIKTGDFRKIAGKQEYVWSAPVSLIYVSDFTKMKRENMTFSKEEKMQMASLNTGHISQNVYLAGTALNLGIVSRGYIDVEAISECLSLSEDFVPILGQTIGNKS